MCNRALFTDLYELTMAQAYQAEGMDQFAVFELAFREMPQNRNYIVAAGFQDVLGFLDRFSLFSRRSRLFAGAMANFQRRFSKDWNVSNSRGMFMQCPREPLSSPTSRCCR